ELTRRSPSPQGDFLQLRLARAVRIELVEPRRGDPARRHAVDRDAPGADLPAQRLQPRGEPRAERVREGEMGARLLGRERRGGEEHDVRSLVRQRLGAREAEARRGAADERSAPVQPQIHVSGSSPELATTRVVIPPRAANSPSTSTKRGPPSATSRSSTSFTTS